MTGDTSDIYGMLRIPDAGGADGAGGAGAPTYSERAVSAAKLHAERETSEDALQLMVEKMSQQKAQADAAMKIVVDRTKAELDEMKAQLQAKDHTQSQLVDRVETLLGDVFETKAATEQALSTRGSIIEQERAQLERREAKHRAALDRRRALLLARQKNKLAKQMVVPSMSDEAREPEAPLSPVSDTPTTLSLDRLALERRGSSEGLLTSPRQLLAMRGARPGAAPAPGGGGGGGDLLGDPNAMWQMISGSRAADADKLAAAQAQLEYLQQQEQQVLSQLRQASAAQGRSRRFGDDETVFDDDFENGTLIDHDTGEVFGFAGGLGDVEEEVYGFGGL